MARSRTVARCRACGHEGPRWVGRCTACGEWGTVEELEATAASGPRPTAVRPAEVARPVSEIPLDSVARLRSGLDELDRVLGGGFVPGSIVLVGGEPGIGKSTLLLQAAEVVARSGATVLYVSAEESPGQVRLRAERVGVTSPRLLLSGTTDLTTILALSGEHTPALLVVDSVQTILDPEVASAAGSVPQVRATAAALARHGKTTGAAVALVGHVTKEGAIAGPRVLEHLVDAVLGFEGDRHHTLRLLRAVKNRFGPAGEVGCFEMVSEGLSEVRDPSRLLLGEHRGDATGGVATVTVEGPRPLAVEVQALVAKSALVNPRRQASGLDGSRLPLLVAVLHRRAGVDLAEHDLFASAAGGVRLREPAGDLALCLAIASARHDRALPATLVAIGEVGLGGELRAVPQLPRRLAEARRLGFERAVVPARYDGPAHGLTLVRHRDLAATVADLVPRGQPVVAVSA